MPDLATVVPGTAVERARPPRVPARGADDTMLALDQWLRDFIGP